MINAIIKGIFALIMMLFNLLFSPLISIVTSLFPNLGNLFTYLSNYIVIGLTYVRSILALLMINDTMIRQVCEQVTKIWEQRSHNTY